MSKLEHLEQLELPETSATAVSCGVDRDADVARVAADPRLIEYFTPNGEAFYYHVPSRRTVWHPSDLNDDDFFDDDDDSSAEEDAGPTTTPPSPSSRSAASNAPHRGPNGIATKTAANPFGAPWHYDRDTGELRWEQPPPPPPVEEIPTPRLSVFTELVLLRSGPEHAHWSASYSWLRANHRNRSRRWCVDHDTDGGGWILVGRAMLAGPRFRSLEPSLSHKQRPHPSPPLAPFGRRRAACSLSTLARLLDLRGYGGVRGDTAALREIRVFACCIETDVVAHLKVRESVT